MYMYLIQISGNQITELTGLSGLTSLSTLIVSDNRIERIQGLDNLPIETLNLVQSSCGYYFKICHLFPVE